jgi:23S rRNA (adenine2030-N6)-methyltransferase
MLSYRHIFHAGNHADVLKHLTLILCCEHLCKKDKAFCYVDTHAGAGMYNLNSEAAKKNQEYRNGINTLYDHIPANTNTSNNSPEKSLPPSVFKPYLTLIEQARKQNPNAYPGSPWFAAEILRPYDQLHLFELHPNDFQKLAQLFSGDKRIKVKQQDGYQSLKSLLPPAARRGLILIDPPYEQEKEYQAVLNTLKEGIKRFNSGVYIIWYPLINREASAKSKASEKMLKHIQSDFPQEQLHVQFIANAEAKGMYGSGLAIINPPWGLKEQLQEALDFLCSTDKNHQRQFKLASKL